MVFAEKYKKYLILEKMKSAFSLRQQQLIIHYVLEHFISSLYADNTNAP